MNYLNHIITTNNVCVSFAEKTVVVSKENPVYPKLEQALRQCRFTKIEKLSNLAQAISQYSDGEFFVVDNEIYIKGYDGPAPNGLSQKIIKFMEDGEDHLPLVRFWQNLIKNPSEVARIDLFSFLESSHIPLTEDGYFIAYKKVSINLKDIRTGRIDNSPGAIVEMLRSQVDDDPNNTCSHGLHVCSWPYLSHYGSAPGNKIVSVKVNPADVVAIPTDYSNQKMRLCKYEVLDVYNLDGEILDNIVRTQAQDEEDENSLEVVGCDSDDVEEYDEDPVDLVTMDLTANGKNKTPEEVADINSSSITGRLTIPRKIVSSAGFLSGDTLVVERNDGQEKITLTKNGSGVISVHNSGNIMLNPTTLKEVFGSRTSFKTSAFDGKIVIE